MLCQTHRWYVAKDVKTTWPARTGISVIVSPVVEVIGYARGITSSLTAIRGRYEAMLWYRRVSCKAGSAVNRSL